MTSGCFNRSTYDATISTLGWEPEGNATVLDQEQRFCSHEDYLNNNKELMEYRTNIQVQAELLSSYTNPNLNPVFILALVLNNGICWVWFWSLSTTVGVDHRAAVEYLR